MRGLGIFIFLSGVLLSGSDALMCLSCSGVSHLKYCLSTIDCAAGDVCFVDRLDATDGPKYFAGCKPNTECSSTVCSTTSYVCRECCQGDLCNAKGCGSQLDDPNDTEKVCFNCDNLSTHSRCYHLTRCPTGRSCLRGLASHQTFSLSCTSRLTEQYVCDRVATSSFSPTKCCNSTFCNFTPDMNLQFQSHMDPGSVLPVTKNIYCNEVGRYKQQVTNRMAALTCPSTAQATTTSFSVCTDKEAHCGAIDTLYGICQVPDRAASLCAKTCNMCSAPRITMPPCVDKESNCPFLDGTYGLCRVPDKARDLCAKTCNLCPPGTLVG